MERQPKRGQAEEQEEGEEDGDENALRLLQLHKTIILVNFLVHDFAMRAL